MVSKNWSQRNAANRLVVSDIPGDQRSIRTIAKIGDLVGKVVEIDEMTRFRADYVKVKIACRDLQKVPSTAKGTLGLCIHDFGFEREIQEDSAVKNLFGGIVVGSKEPPSKKHKVEDHIKPILQIGSSSQSIPKVTKVGSSKNSQQQKVVQVCSSAPQKCLVALQLRTKV